MPRMAEFLRTNGPWKQLVELGNIDLRLLEDKKPVKVSASITVTPFNVTHRGEFSETVPFLTINTSLGAGGDDDGCSVGLGWLFHRGSPFTRAFLT